MSTFITVKGNRQPNNERFVTRKKIYENLFLKMRKSSSSSQAKTQNGVFKAAKIWIVQNNLLIPGLNQLRRDYIAFFGITNKKSVPGVCEFKRAIERI